MSTKSNQPNYRIYDQTGGGVTEDIYAESLEDAIRQGREWIEGGCWEALSYDQTLSCAVVEIVRDEDGDIDEDATWEAKRHDCSGTLAAAEGPECSAGEHDWRSPFSLVGGIKENPGVWGSGHGKVSTKEVCACCGCYRMINYGATESATGQNVTTTNYEPADDASRAWLMRRLNLPDEIEIKGATVTLEWDKTADITEEDEVIGKAIHTVPSADLDEGTADGPVDGETFDHEGITFRLGSHDYETNGDETTCTASIYRVMP